MANASRIFRIETNLHGGAVIMQHPYKEFFQVRGPFFRGSALQKIFPIIFHSIHQSRQLSEHNQEYLSVYLS